MAGEISLATRTEVLGAIRSRYGEASKKDKSRMLDDFVAITGENGGEIMCLSQKSARLPRCRMSGDLGSGG